MCTLLLARKLIMSIDIRDDSCVSIGSQVTIAEKEQRTDTKKSTGWIESKYKPEYCDIAINLMGEGASFAEVAAALLVRRSTIYEWEKVHPEFAAALELARDVSEAWWSKFIRFQCSNPDLESANTALIMINMRNRFSWRSKDVQEAPISVQLSTSDTTDLSKIVEIAAKARAEVNKIKE